jgi:beta-phosphoglucomutase family hydrolase
MAEESTRAVIFDMDGVIVDTAPYHFQAWQEVFQKRRIDFTREAFQHVFGQRDDNVIRVTLGEATPPGEIAAIGEEKETLYRKLVKPNVRALPGAIKLITSLRKYGFKTAIASSAVPENLRLIIETLGIISYFDATVYGIEVAESKPSPQVFLLAARRLGVVPTKCIVIEDAVAGVTAAKRAGMCAVAVTNTHPKESLTEADLIIDSLAEVTASTLEKLLD